ncbi:MAG: hypothetical protein RI996_444 [Candidatus Parcubacteria bacterium]|jgi:hypothetical protein
MTAVEQITYLFTHLGIKTWSILLIVLFILVVELILRLSKKKISTEYATKVEMTERFGDIEGASLRYYRLNQHIDIARVVVISLGISALIFVFNVQAFSVLAVATGAIILVLREPITSFVAYFYIVSVYDIGDDIRVKGFLGEIVRQRPLYTALAGKDDNGDYNGKLTLIPNNILMNDIVEEQELKVDAYRRVSMPIYYIHNTFREAYPEWNTKFRAFLDELLPIRKTVGGVGNYKGYVGLRYKTRTDYSEKGDILITLSFISKPEKIASYKQQIVEYIESTRKHEVENAGKSANKVKQV